MGAVVFLDVGGSFSSVWLEYLENRKRAANIEKKGYRQQKDRNQREKERIKIDKVEKNR